jgi:hypothetical protein
VAERPRHTDPAWWERARACISEGFCPDGHRLDPAPELLPPGVSGGLCRGHGKVHWTRAPDSSGMSTTAV